MKNGFGYSFRLSYHWTQYVIMSRMYAHGFHFGTSVRHSSQSAFERSTGNDVSGHYKRHYLFFSIFSIFLKYFDKIIQSHTLQILGHKLNACTLCKMVSSILGKLSKTPVWGWGSHDQGVIFPAGVRVFPAGNLQNPQEILTKTLIIEQVLWYFENFNKIISQNSIKINME